MYSVRGLSGQATSTLNNAVFGIWNPHSSQIIRLMAVALSVQNNSAQLWEGNFRRTTARGTPASTVTPGISNDGRYGVAPVSGMLLDLGAYSAEPTLEAGDFDPVIFGGVNSTSGIGVFQAYRFHGSGLYIPPGAGVALIGTIAQASPAFEIGLSWLEDF